MSEGPYGRYQDREVGGKAAGHHGIHGDGQPRGLAGSGREHGYDLVGVGSGTTREHGLDPRGGRCDQRQAIAPAAEGQYLDQVGAVGHL